MASRYEKSVELQKVLDAPVDDEEFKLHYMKMSLEDINTGWKPLQPRLVHSAVGYHIDDRLTKDSYMYPTRMFGEVILKGTVPEVRCIQLFGRYVVTMPFFEPVILGPQQEIETEIVDLDLEIGEVDTVLPLGVAMRRPIYIPVEDMSFSMLTAK